MKTTIHYFTVTALTLFGLVTLFLSTSILIDLFGIRAMVGNYVPFVVWANFISGVLYLISAYGFVKRKNWTANLLGISAFVLIVVYTGLFLHIHFDGRYESNTISAMAFRIVLTLMFMAVAFFSINRRMREA